jgi:hypothetical protein
LRHEQAGGGVWMAPTKQARAREGWSFMKRLSRGRLGRVPGREDGKSLFLLALLLPVLLLFLAFAVDGAHVFADRNTGFPQTS